MRLPRWLKPVRNDGRDSVGGRGVVHQDIVPLVKIKQIYYDIATLKY